VDLLLTRDGSTFAAYLNGSSTPQYSFVDSDNLAVATLLGGNAVFHFFRDDFLTGEEEASAGRVDEIRIWYGALAPAEIANAFTPIPEPSTEALKVVALLGVGFVALRQYHRQQVR